MNRVEFMKQLELLLRGISDAEREEALQYYSDYFNDAGDENEQDVIIALGTPAKVAEIIKSGIIGKSDEKYEFTDSGFQNGTEKRNNEIAVTGKLPEAYSEFNKKEEKKSLSPIAILLIILGVIILFPIWIPFVAAAFGVVVSILAILFVALLAVGIGGIAVLVVGIVLFVVGLFKIFITPLASICLIGAGLILLGLGLLFLIATTWLVAKAIPAVIRGIVAVCRMPFRGKEGKTA